MKTDTRRYLSRWVVVVACLIGLILVPSPALSEETYVFERMWPTLQQPWYFNNPNAVAVDSSGNVYIADTGNDRIQKFSSDGTLITIWGSHGFGDGQFYYPAGIAIDGSGNVYVADANNDRIQKFTSDGTFITKWGSYGSTDGKFSVPQGIATDSSGNVYVADWSDRIQKFTQNGDFITKWGSSGSGDGEFDDPEGIATDSSGRVYVADTNNHRIQVFTSDGTFITKWGSSGSGDGTFLQPHGIATDGSGNVYVADTYNHRIQKFMPDGSFITEWGSRGNGDGEFRLPYGIATDSSGNVYVADGISGCIQKFSSDGTFFTSWRSSGTANGQFLTPGGIATDASGNVYVADSWNYRIQKFTWDGSWISIWGGYGSGEFDLPHGIATDSSGNIYVADTWKSRIQKFTSDGTFITEWGIRGSGDGEFNTPFGIALDSSGNIYVADTNNNRIQVFTSDGTFLATWGSEGSGDGEFNYPNGIAVDASGNVYVADTYNDRIQKFTSDGTFVDKWGSFGSGDGEFGFPKGLATDAIGYVYVADSENDRIQKFSSNGQFITKFGGSGSDVGQLSAPGDLCVSANGGIYVADTGNHRIQVFSSGTILPPDEKVNKAIILAGGGPFPGNNIWDATAMCANYAYRALTYQGYTKDTIYYLSSDTDLDLDGNGLADDVDADATNSNFQNALGNWAENAEDLFIYAVDHGGDATFRMGETELLQASELDTWLDEVQQTIPGSVTLLYDACRSGSFLSVLDPPSGKERVVAASASADEEAIFGSQGTISFSFLFWARMFNGDSFYDSFVQAMNGIGVTYNQNPQLEGNGNTTHNEREDLEAARALKIGNETKTGGDIPGIGSVSPGQTLYTETLATIYAADVIDADGISRVWAVITPPGYSSDSPDNPVTDLPILDLSSVGNNRYEGTYNSFTTEGTYNIAIYAMDRLNVISIPQQTTITQELGEEPPPVARFSCTPTSGSAPLMVMFTDESTGQIDSWSWDFGDGGSSTEQNPTHTYDSAGSYTVSLTVSSPGGSDTASETDYITVSGEEAPPVARFSCNSTSGSAPLTVTFTDQSTGQIDSWSWDFGDGASSTEQNPTHTYDGVGTYTVSLTVTGSAGSDTESKTGHIIVSETEGPEDGFQITDELWIRAVIDTEEKGPVEAVWQKGGEDETSADDRVIWGHFYANPDDVSWGSENNPELFVKIWFDHGGRLDVNFFHVSVPDIEVYSGYPYDGSPDTQDTTTLSTRYVRQYYENGQSYSEENEEDGVAPEGYSPSGNPWGSITINSLRIGAIINTVEAGPIEAVWDPGGQDTTTRGDQVVWGHFYANPANVSWGSLNNPELFVKIWFDVDGRLDVNFFHVSVPDIEVYSDFPNDSTYDQKGTCIMADRYIRHEYQR